MARNGVVPNRRCKSESEIDLCLSQSPSEAHVLAVDDSVIDRKVIEKLLRTSSCKGRSLWSLEQRRYFRMFAFCGPAWGCFNGGNDSDSLSIFDAVTAVDSGMRALEFLGLDEHQRSSVVDVSFQIYRITLAFLCRFSEIWLLRFYYWGFVDDCLGFEGRFNHHWLLYAWNDRLWAPQTNQGLVLLSFVSVSVQKSDLDGRNRVKQFWN